MRNVGIISRVRAILLLLPLLAGTVVAQYPTEQEAYSNVVAARTLARRLDNATTLRRFVAEAERFLEKHPRSPRRDNVYLWLGDLLRDDEPRRALRYYRLSQRPEARLRARDLSFLFEPAPELQVVEWIGPEARPDRPDGRVTMVVFVSPTHPVTGRLLRQLRTLSARLGPGGLRIITVAAVVDDHANQTPARIRAWARNQDIPFPLAIDQQIRNRASVSLQRYRGNRVPLGVFLDRYGRIVWIGSLSLERNALQQCEAKLRALLADPDYTVLEERATSGNEAALRRLLSLKTPTSLSSLYRVHGAKPEERIAEATADGIRKLAPRGFGLDDAKRWEEARDEYRYSFEDDRLIRKPPAERQPVLDRDRRGG
ncbi:MAG: hypothetical protein AAGD14_05130 [Planctomycetota bacterium]